MIKTEMKKTLMALLVMVSVILTFNTYAYANLDKVVLQLRWNHQFQFAGYYAAKWQGYYEEEGLDVEIRSGSGAKGNTQFAPDEVTAGNADFGIGSSDILVANDKSKELMVLASVFQKSPVRYYMLESSDYTNLADLAKKNVGIREDDLLSIEFKTMLIVEGIDPQNISLVDKHAVFVLEDLKKGKYDLIPGYKGGIIDYYAQKEGIKLDEIKAIDYGIDFYGDSLFTRRELAESDPEKVERFRRASMKGWEYALNNKEEIIARIVKEYQNNEVATSRDFLDYNKYQAQNIEDLMLYPVVEVGNINPHRWGEMAKSLKRFGIIEEELDIENFVFDYEKIVTLKQTDDLNLALRIISIIFTLSVGGFLLNLSSKKMDLEKEVQDRIKAERELKKEKERYEVLFNSSIIGIVLTRKSGQIVQWNKKWLDMTGYSELEMAGKNMKELISPDENRVPNELMTKLVSGDIEEYEVEQKYVRRNGECFWGNLFMVDMEDADSGEKIYLNMIADITNKKMMEESVKRAEVRFRNIVEDVAAEINILEGFEIKEGEDDKLKVLSKLEHINMELEKMFKNELEENRKKEVLIIHQAKLAAMGEMIGNIAHQWRQPLNSLMIVLANLEDAYEYGELDGEYMERVMKKCRSLISAMSETIDDFRYFYNPISDKEEFNPCESIESILYLLEEKLRFNDINVVFSECDKELVAYGYKGQYSQALFNVISNSIDALSEMEMNDRRIEIKVYESKSELVSEIQDNAGGIEEDILGKVFDMYFTTKSGKKGTGLGLYITKSIVEKNLNGSIKCKNIKNGLLTEISIPKESEVG